MGPAIELFLLLLFGLAVVAGGLLYFTRPIWKRAAKTIVDTDRREREQLEEAARERAEEAECRRRAEEELKRALKREDAPYAAERASRGKTRGEAGMPCDETRAVQEHRGDRQ